MTASLTTMPNSQSLEVQGRHVLHVVLFLVVLFPQMASSRQLRQLVVILGLAVTLRRIVGDLVLGAWRLRWGAKQIARLGQPRAPPQRGSICQAPTHRPSAQIAPTDLTASLQAQSPHDSLPRPQCPVRGSSLVGGAPTERLEATPERKRGSARPGVMLASHVAGGAGGDLPGRWSWRGRRAPPVQST